jgi:hypothetical protein
MKSLTRIITVMTLIALDLNAESAIQRASGQELPPITTSDFALDLFEGAVIGTSKVVAMGGASQALAEGSAGAPSNPSATAVRATTDSEWFNWDFHIELASRRLTKDFDNNGLRDSSKDKIAGTLGLSLGFGTWGVAVGSTFSVATLDELGQQEAVLTRTELSVAHLFQSVDLGIGLAYRQGIFSFSDKDNDLFEVNLVAETHISAFGHNRLSP